MLFYNNGSRSFGLILLPGTVDINLMAHKVPETIVVPLTVPLLPTAFF
jgi:hypothetical protein